MSTVIGKVIGEKLYRNSLLLMADSAVSAGLGFVFWTLASRTFAASVVGVVAAMIGAVTLASTVATLGLPNTIVRYLASEQDQGALLRAAWMAVAAAGLLAAAVWSAVPGHFGVPVESVTHQWWVALLLLAAAVVANGVGNIADAGLIARREPEFVLVTDALGGVVKIVCIPLAAGLGAEGLFGSFIAATTVAAVSATIVVAVRAGRMRSPDRMRLGFAPLSGKVSFTAGNHLATLVAILPTTTLPVFAVAIIGSRDAAYLAVPLMIVGLLNVIPAMMAQSLYAELSADSTQGVGSVKKALGATYLLAIPAIALLVLVSHPLLTLFGAAYASHGAACLRLLALAGLLASFNYIADVILLARFKVAGYVFLNVAGTVCALGFPVLMMTHNLRDVGIGWVFGQMGYTALALGTLVVCFGSVLRRMRRTINGEVVAP